MKRILFLYCMIFLSYENLPAQTNPINKGLWGVRREDFSTVYNAGFRAVRPPYPNSGSIYTKDNYDSTAAYARAAKNAGFTKLVFDCGLKGFYMEYCRAKHDPAHPAKTRWGIDTTLAAIWNAVRVHMDSVFNAGNGMLCYPYIDEPDGIGTPDKADDLGNPVRDADSVPCAMLDGIVLWKGVGIQLWNGIILNDNCGQCTVVRNFTDLVDSTNQYAIRKGSRLIIATTSPEIFDPVYSAYVRTGNANTACPSTFYNAKAGELMSSRYWWPGKMDEILLKLRSADTSKKVSQIMNFFDRDFGFRFSGLADDPTYGVVNQIIVNKYYSSWHWFYEGEYITRDTTVGYYDAANSPIKYVHSNKQWAMLLDAIYQYENPNYSSTHYLSTEWIEQDGKIGGWKNIKYDDKYFSGSFRQQVGDSSKLLVVHYDSNDCAASFRYRYSISNGGIISKSWDNYGNGYIGRYLYGQPVEWRMAYTDHYISMRNDNGNDFLLARNVGTGWVSLLYQDQNWDWWTTWHNQGNGKISGWVLSSGDQFTAGNFKTSTTGDELLTVNAVTGWASLMHYNNGQWAELWSRGNSHIGDFHTATTDKYIAGDFNHDGVDELLCVCYTSGWAALYKYADTGWVNLWHNTGDSVLGGWRFSGPDIYAGGKLRGLLGDELFIMNANSGWAAILRYFMNSWHTLWQNGGSGKINSWDIISNAQALISDFNGPNDKERLILLNDKINDTSVVIARLTSNISNLQKEPSTEEYSTGIPLEYKLGNYPNPFNPMTNIYFQLPSASFVSLKIYNLLGQEVMTLVNDKQDAGYHSVSFDASRLPSGVYIYRLKAGSFIESKKLLLLK